MVGQEDYDRIRPLSYPDTDVVLIAFSVDSPLSLRNVEEKWVSEVLHFCHKIPILLIALKSDLRDDAATIEKLAQQGLHPVTMHEGQAMAKKIGAASYIECSAKCNIGVKEVFEEAASLSLSSGAPSSKSKRKSSKKFCRIL